VLDDTVIIALVPGCVEVAKRSGLPPRMAPIAALAMALLLVALSHLAGDPDPLTVGVAARLILTGLIDGLAAIGLYRIVPRAEGRGQRSGVSSRLAVVRKPKTENRKPL
jgi:hypothetical protein